jgi:hypothetical protein
MSGGYGHDKAHVWLRGVHIQGADPDNFEALGYGFSHDDDQIWQDTTQVLSLDPETEESASIVAHSARIFSVGTDTWLAGEPTTRLPETPSTEITSYCRDWFSMNNAIWLGTNKRLVVDNPVALIDCDSSVLTRYENGEGREDRSANDGAVFRIGAAIWHFPLEDDPTEIVSFPEPISSTYMDDGGYDTPPFLLARAETGMVYATHLRPHAKVQTLGHFASLPKVDGTYQNRAFWIEDHYFIVGKNDDTTGTVVTDLGVGQRLNDMALIDGVLYDRSDVLARPGAAPLRVAGTGTILIGAACFNFGNYVTDVPDLSASDQDIWSQCDTMRRPESILYDGLRIGFAPRLVELGAGDSDPTLNLLQIGSISFANVSDNPLIVPATFFEGFELQINGTVIAPPDDAWPDEGAELASGETHSWTLKVQTDADPTYWGWGLKMTHSAQRSLVFGDEPFYIGSGQF